MSISLFLLAEMVGDLAPGQIADVFVPVVKAAPADQPVQYDWSGGFSPLEGSLTEILLRSGSIENLPQLQAPSSSLMQSLPPIVGQLLPRGFTVSLGDKRIQPK